MNSHVTGQSGSAAGQLAPLAGFLRLPQVLALYPVSASTWWAGVRAGRFPQPVKLGARATAWRAEEIAALIEAAVMTQRFLHRSGR